MSPSSTPTEAAGCLPPRRVRLQGMASHFPGMALSGAIALASFGLCRMPSIQACGVSMLVVAMAVGMLIGNTIYGSAAGACAPGVSFAKQKLLRFGIVLYGLRLTFHDIGQMGLSGILIDLLIVLSTFSLALVIGKAVLKLDRNTVLLIGAGSSICGAAAVLATDPVVKGRPEQVTVAVSTVVIFGTVATFLYPLLYQLNGHWKVLPASIGAFGIYAGSTIHEVAQVVAAARSVDADAVDMAVIAKMVRVMMLSPFLLGLALYLAFGATLRGAGPDRQRRMPDAAVLGRSIPWFAVGFIAVVALNSFLPLPAAFIIAAKNADTLLLMMAMAALGLTTQIAAFRLAGVRPIALAAILFVWLVVGGAWINYLVPRLLP